MQIRIILKKLLPFDGRMAAHCGKSRFRMSIWKEKFMATKKILTLIPMEPSQRVRLEAVMPDWEFIYKEVNELTGPQVCDADIILGNAPVQLLSRAEHLEWLHLNSAGYEQYLTPGVLRKETLLTNSTGAYGKAVSEHMFAMTLALQKRLPLYRDNQKRHIWRDEGTVVSMSDARVLVLGMGRYWEPFRFSGTCDWRICDRCEANAGGLSVLCR